jgi:methylglyoxal synthase
MKIMGFRITGNQCATTKKEIMNYSNHLRAVKRIAFMADDDKKTTLIHWSYFNRHSLAGHEIISARPMDRILEGTLNTTVQSVENNELYSMITEGQVDALIIFSDTLNDQESVSSKILTHAAASGVIVAPNERSADVFVHSLRSDLHVHQPRTSQAV